MRESCELHYISQNKKAFIITLILMLTLPFSLLSQDNDSVLDLGTMVITAQVPLDDFIHRYDAIGELQFDTKEITKLPTVGEKDIARALKYVPGVSGANENSSELIVHGGAPEQNLTIFDEIPIYSVDHFFGFFSPFNTDAVQGVKLYKTFFPSWYGGRLSSVQDYTGLTGNYDTLSVGGNVSMLSASAYLTIPIAKRASILVSGRRSYSDLVKTPLYSSIFNQFTQQDEMKKSLSNFQMDRNPAFYFYDFNAKISVNIGDKDSIVSSLYLGKDNLATNSEAHGYGKILVALQPDAWVPRSVDVKLENSGNWGNKGASGVWFRKWGEHFNTKLVGGYSTYFFDNRENFWTGSELGLKDSTQTVDFQSRQSRESENSIDDIFTSLTGKLNLGESHMIDFGTEWKQWETHYYQIESMTDVAWREADEYDPVYDSTSVYSNDQREDLTSFWVQDQISVGDKFTAVLGARGALYTGDNSFNVSPRVSMVWDVNRLLSLRGNWGLYAQYLSRAQMLDLYLEGDRYFWVLAGDDASKVAQANKSSLGISFKPAGFLIDIEGYYNVQENISIYKPSYIPSSSTFATGNNYARGFDAMIKKSVGAYSGWVSYSLSQSVYDFGKEINDGRPFYSPHDRTHEVKLVNMLNFKQLNVAATWIFATGAPFETPVGTYQPEQYSTTEVLFGVGGWMNSERLPNYHRLDLSASYLFHVGEKLDITVGSSIFNLYNRKNIRDYGFEHTLNGDGVNAEEQIIYRTESYYLGVVPSAFLSIDFKQPLWSKK